MLIIFHDQNHVVFFLRASKVHRVVFFGANQIVLKYFDALSLRLPTSYVKWYARTWGTCRRSYSTYDFSGRINSLANVDQRFLDTLRAIRNNDWSYIRGSLAHSHLLMNVAQDLGKPRSWGDPAQIPAYGGPSANATWQKIGVTSRADVGGFPCEVVHGDLGLKWGFGSGCAGNAAIRFALAFVEAMALYLPVRALIGPCLTTIHIDHVSPQVHFLPILLTRPSSILRLHRIVLPTTLHAFRSAAFLSTFLTSCWYGVCLTRSIVLARLFPWISHDVWDGPYGGIMVGSLLCGSSIWIENGRRRGEMALYVLPRAIRSLLPHKWMMHGNLGIKLIERSVSSHLP